MNELTSAQSRTLHRYATADYAVRLYPDEGRAVAHTPDGLFLHAQRWEVGQRRWGAPYVLRVAADGLGHSAARPWNEILLEDFGEAA